MVVVDGLAQERRNLAWAGWLSGGVGLGLVGCYLLELARDLRMQAQIETGATFQIPKGKIALSDLLFLLVGVVFVGIVLLAGRGAKHRRVGLLAGGLIPPLYLLVVFWDFIGPDLIPPSFRVSPRMLVSGYVHTGAAVAVGILLAGLLWQVLGRREEP